MEFAIPLHPEDLLSTKGSQKYALEMEVNVESLSESSQNKLLDGTNEINQLILFSEIFLKIKKQGSLQITSHQVFDPLFLLLE
jgi:hypothetical protein